MPGLSAAVSHGINVLTHMFSPTRMAGRVKRLVAAQLETYRTALAPIDFLKQGFAERFADAYGAMVTVLMARGRAGDALAAAERVRGRAFADLLQGRRLREQNAYCDREFQSAPP